MARLNDYRIACQHIAEDFRNKYFSNIDNIDMYAIAGDVTGVWEFNDNFFSVNKMYEFMLYNYTEKELSDYCEYVENGGKICIRDWKKLK
jgi:hypothetical protein